MNDFNHIFTFTEKLDSRKTPRPYWQITFKHNGKQFKTALTRERAEALAYNWINNPKNEQAILDISTELLLIE